MQNGSSVGTCTHCIHVSACFGADLHAQSVLINKFFASELSRMFVKSALLVGMEGGRDKRTRRERENKEHRKETHLLFTYFVRKKGGRW